MNQYVAVLLDGSLHRAVAVHVALTSSDDQDCGDVTLSIHGTAPALQLVREILRQLGDEPGDELVEIDLRKIGMQGLLTPAADQVCCMLTEEESAVVHERWLREQKRMKTHRLRRESHLGSDGRRHQALVTAVRAGEEVIGANVWARGKDEAVFVSGDDLKRVSQELAALAEERRTY